MQKMLTTRTLEAIRPAKETREVRDVAVGGLSVRYGAKGRPTFFLRYRDRAGKQFRVRLGYFWAGPGEAPPGWITLRDARQRAYDIKEAAAKGMEAPPPIPPSAATAELCSTVVEKHVLDHLSTLRRFREQEHILRTVLAPFASKPIDAVTRADIRTVVDGYAERGKGVMANRVFSCLSVFFSWAVEREYLDTSPLAGMRRPMKKEVARDRVLSDAELATVWHGADRMHPAMRDAVRLLILTGLRRNEAAKIRWDDIRDTVLTIPAERSKNGMAFDVPLSPQALAIVNAQEKRGPYVFTCDGRRPVGRSLSTMKGRRLDGALNIAEWTLHDLRRTVATGLQRLGVAPEVIDKCLNHSVVVKGVAAVYMRGKYLDERTAAMQAWAEHVTKLIS
jgi:integrase